MSKLALPIILACIVAGVVFLAVTKSFRQETRYTADSVNDKFVPKVSDSSFQTDVLDSSSAVLVDFNADWCRPCRAMVPVVHQLGVELDGRAKVVSMNVDDNPTTSNRYGISGLPSFVVFKNGKPVDRVVGSASKDRLMDMVEKHL